MGGANAITGVAGRWLDSIPLLILLSNLHTKKLNIEYRTIGNLENTDLVMNNLFWTGVYPGLIDEKLDYVIKIIGKFIKELKYDEG